MGQGIDNIKYALPRGRLWGRVAGIWQFAICFYHLNLIWRVFVQGGDQNGVDGRSVMKRNWLN